MVITPFGRRKIEKGKNLIQSFVLIPHLPYAPCILQAVYKKYIPSFCLQQPCCTAHEHFNIFEEEEVIDRRRMEFCGGAPAKGESECGNRLFCWRTAPTSISLQLVAKWVACSELLEVIFALPLFDSCTFVR